MKGISGLLLGCIEFIEQFETNTVYNIESFCTLP